MDAKRIEAIAANLGLVGSHWMMSPAERFAVIGLLAEARPTLTLEIGYGMGEGTAVLSRLSREVYTVDVHERVLEAATRFANVHPWHGTSQDALRAFTAERRRFDVCIIDGEHSAAMTEADLRLAVPLADVILLHDTVNPECRSGYERALAKLNVYANLDWVDGRLQDDGAWGGLGVVLPSYPRHQPYQLSPISITNHQLIMRELNRRTGSRTDL